MLPFTIRTWFNQKSRLSLSLPLSPLNPSVLSSPLCFRHFLRWGFHRFSFLGVDLFGLTAKSHGWRWSILEIPFSYWLRRCVSNVSLAPEVFSCWWHGGGMIDGVCVSDVGSWLQMIISSESLALIWSEPSSFLAGFWRWLIRSVVMAARRGWPAFWGGSDRFGSVRLG